MTMLKLVVSAILVSMVTGAVIRTEFFDEEIQNDLTCWTCPEKDNNTQCNLWAPDVPCHLNHSVCQTVHVINMTTQASMYVTKQCTTRDECLPEHIGCTRNFTAGIMECVSCCTESYCNEAVPFNHTHALSLTSLELMASSASNLVATWCAILVLIAIAFTQ